MSLLRFFDFLPLVALEVNNISSIKTGLFYFIDNVIRVVSSSERKVGYMVDFDNIYEYKNLVERCKNAAELYFLPIKALKNIAISIER